MIGFRIFQLSGYLLFFAIVLSFAYLVKTEVQITLGLISFFATRYAYNKTYHCVTLLKCMTVSIGIFILYSIFSLPIHITILTNVLLGCYITYNLYFLKDYLDDKEIINKLNKTLESKKNFKIYKGMKLEELHNIIDCIGLEDMFIKILENFYCRKRSLTEIANSIGFTYQYTHELKAKALSMITEYYNKDAS